MKQKYKYQIMGRSGYIRDDHEVECASISESDQVIHFLDENKDLLFSIPISEFRYIRRIDENPTD